MTNGRKRIFAGIAGLAVFGAITVVPGSPAQAEPTIDEVKEKVDKLYRKAEVASERYNGTQERLTELRQELKGLKADERRQQRAMKGIKTQLRQAVLTDFESAGASDVTRVLTAEDPESFLAGLTSASTYNTLQSDMIQDYDVEVTSLEQRREATQDRVDEVKDLRDDQKDAKDEIDANVAKAEELLDDLEAEQREELQAQSRPAAPSRSGEREPATSSVPASGRAGTAVNFAMAQVGKAYVYGASGPSAYDCSGLTGSAWAAAGVSLPRTSSAQYSAGTPVSQSELKPGDLVFYYSPISHVGMYIGNGQIVHAANPSTGVQVTSVNSMPYSGATRVG